MNKRERKGTYWVGQNSMGTVEVFWTDVPPRFVPHAHPSYKAVVGPFPSRSWAEKVENAPWRASEIIKEARGR